MFYGVTHRLEEVVTGFRGVEAEKRQREGCVQSAAHD